MLRQEHHYEFEGSMGYTVSWKLPWTTEILSQERQVGECVLELVQYRIKWTGMPAVDSLFVSVSPVVLSTSAHFLQVKSLGLRA